jgi:hypothetical protein
MVRLAVAGRLVPVWQQYPGRLVLAGVVGRLEKRSGQSELVWQQSWRHLE